MKGHIRAFLDTLANQLDYSSSTCLAYKSDLSCFVSYLQESLGRFPTLADFTPEHVARFLKAESRAGKRQSTVLRRRATLRRFALYLDQQGLLKPDLFDINADLIDEAITAGGTVKLPQSLSPAEISRLWSALESSARPRARRDQAILALLLETGLTVGSLVALNLKDIDGSGSQLCIHTDQGQAVWLPLRAASGPLKRYIKEGRPELNLLPDEPALFVSQAGRRMSRQGIWQILRHWGRAIGLPVTLSPRLVRHTAAITLVKSGRSYREIQILMGHRNPLSTRALLRRLEITHNAAAENSS
jgi:integrase/recombinase XerD